MEALKITMKNLKTVGFPAEFGTKY